MNTMYHPKNIEFNQQDLNEYEYDHENDDINEVYFIKTRKLKTIGKGTNTKSSIRKFRRTKNSPKYIKKMRSAKKTLRDISRRDTHTENNAFKQFEDRCIRQERINEDMERERDEEEQKMEKEYREKEYREKEYREKERIMRNIPHCERILENKLNTAREDYWNVVHELDQIMLHEDELYNNLIKIIRLKGEVVSKLNYTENEMRELKEYLINIKMKKNKLMHTYGTHMG